MFEFILPFIYGGVLYMVNQSFNCPSGKVCTEQEMAEKHTARNFLLPFLMVFFIPNIVGTAGTFIIKTMVVDKENKMRDTLKLMSLTHHAYAWSYLIFQSAFAVVNSFIMGAFVFNDKKIFPKDTLNDSFKFIMALMIMYMAQIPTIMSLSTFFNNDKVANFFVNVVNGMIALVYIMIVTLEGAQK